MPILVIVLAFGVMIFIHELGHFITAKIFGVLVHEFSMGMGPKLFSFRKGETQYSLRLFPIGGYVKLEGETDSSDSDDPRSFMNLKPIKRIIILFAGAFMNLILGFILFTVVNLNVGIIPGVVSEIPKEFQSEANVFMPGDEIVKLNNTKINTYDDVSLFMSRNNEKTVDISLRRDGKLMKFDDYNLIKTEYGYKLGVSFAYRKGTVFECAKHSIYNTCFTTKAVYLALGDLISGKASVSTLSGPVEIIAVVGKETKDLPQNKYTFMWLLSLVAMISVNLGIFNLLPFPALDGGSIIFAFIELITRRKVKKSLIEYSSVIGFALLMLLALFVTADDIYTLIKN